jgi:hypothetical protein
MASHLYVVTSWHSSTSHLFQQQTAERGYETGTSGRARAGTRGHTRHGSKARFAGNTCSRMPDRVHQYRPGTSIVRRGGRLDSRALREAAQGSPVSCADPAGGRRKPPTPPGNPRKRTREKPCSPRESPASRAQTRRALTGLSRRRSQVRVPSLRKIPGNRLVMLRV